MFKLKQNLCFVIIFFQYTLIHSQKYIPLDINKVEKRDVFLGDLKKRADLFLNEIKSKYDVKTAKFIINNYTEFYNEFNNEIKNGKFIFEDEITNYVNSIYLKIKKSNPELDNVDVKILISKEHSLNAYCIADGTFVLNLGLFYWLENEDQIAGVLSHELAHKLLDHGLKKQQRLFSENKIVKQKMSSLKKEKYKVSDKTLSMVKEHLYEQGERAKRHEFEADSLGFLLYKNTNFCKNEYLSTLKLMQKYDSIKPTGLKYDIYRKYFDLPNLSFNEKWLLKEDYSIYDYSKFNESLNKDSISSHPETEERISKLISMFPEINQKKNKIQSENETFKKIKMISYMETVPNLYFEEEFGLSIYVSLLCLERDEENSVFFKQWLGKSFAKILEARKNYTLNRYLHKIIPNQQSESYQQFLNFMWNLNINEIQIITDFYTPKTSN